MTLNGGLLAQDKPADPQPIAVERTPVHIDPKHPLIVHWEYYPTASKMDGEEGACKVRLDVDETGHTSNGVVIASTGYPRLDAACVESLAGARGLPATENGKPAKSTIELPIIWALNTIDQPPRLAGNAKLEAGPEYYPPAAVEMRQQGDCVMHFFVAADGDSAAIQVAQSTGFNTLDHACVMAIKHVRFIPARKMGRSYGTWTDMTLSWKLTK